jgi:hypothetical protein
MMTAMRPANTSLVGTPGPRNPNKAISAVSAGSSAQAAMPQNIRQVFPPVRFHVSLNVKAKSPTARAGSNKLKRRKTAKAARYTPFTS